jgi:hypothetical protein
MPALAHTSESSSTNVIDAKLERAMEIEAQTRSKHATVADGAHNQLPSYRRSRPGWRTPATVRADFAGAGMRDAGGDGHNVSGINPPTVSCPLAAAQVGPAATNNIRPAANMLFASAPAIMSVLLGSWKAGKVQPCYPI